MSRRALTDANRGQHVARNDQDVLKDTSQRMTCFNDPEHWRNRAERARSLADQMKDEAFKQIMLRTAADYGRPAERAELRAQRASRGRRGRG